MSKSSPFYFQDIVAALQEFWAKKGCVILHSYDQMVGAGTLSPYTTLYTLQKPEWNAAYVQYSRRPTDGRFGENPNRLSGYYQFQVILKPAPSDIQAWYLESLAFLGFDVSKNDIRFVEDDWENPSIGASGLGWEVWINGMEATQFTYMKQIGGLEVNPVAGEITYGLERLAMYIQQKDNLFDIEFNDRGVKYRDVFFNAEVEYSKYFQQEADYEKILGYFKDCEGFVAALLAKNLMMPAFDECLKASHYLNILDARGVISATERTNYILRVRELVKQICLKVVDK